jgi:hypothetical protein
MSKGLVRITPAEPLQEDWHDETGNLTFKGYQVLLATINGPQQHHTVDLGIKAFKKFVAEKSGLTKKQQREQINKYKKHAWTEFAEIVQYKGNFPTHPAYN